jgi:hypothetical protein
MRCLRRSIGPVALQQRILVADCCPPPMPRATIVACERAAEAERSAIQRVIWGGER